jgi:hypothetical protein
MTEYIRGKVTGIASETKVYVKLSDEANAKEGMLMIVYEEGPEIQDVDGRPLGKFEIQKARIKLIHNQPGMSIAQSADFFQVYSGSNLTPPDESDYSGPDPGDSLYEWIPKKIASSNNPEDNATGQPDAQSITMRRDVDTLLRLAPRNKLVVVGDLVRSIAPVG